MQSIHKNWFHYKYAFSTFSVRAKSENRFKACKGIKSKLVTLYHEVLVLSTELIRQSESIRSDEGLTFETSAFNIVTVVNLPNQLSW